MGLAPGAERIAAEWLQSDPAMTRHVFEADPGASGPCQPMQSHRARDLRRGGGQCAPSPSCPALLRPHANNARAFLVVRGAAATSCHGAQMSSCQRGTGISPGVLTRRAAPTRSDTHRVVLGDANPTLHLAARASSPRPQPFEMASM